MLRRLSVAAAAAVALAGCGSSSHSSSATGSTTNATTLTQASTTTTAAAPSVTSTTATSTATTAGGLPSGGPVPAQSRATSVTFVSADTGYVLGTAPCAKAPCSEILRTENRGASWVGLPAPVESVSVPEGTGLWGLRFADASHGFAFGAGLWETANGAASWQTATPPAAAILDLEAVQDKELVAVAAACPNEASDCSDAPEGLYHRALSGGAWSQVMSLGTQSDGESVSVQGADVWVLAGDRLLLSSDGGQTFAAVSQPCTSGGNGPGPASITDDGTHAYLLCVGQAGLGSAPKFVYQRNGSTWTQVGRPSNGGDGGTIVAGSEQAIILSATSGASWLYRSGDAGHTWSTALTLDNGGAPWGDVGFENASDAVAIEAPAAVGPDSDASVDVGKLLFSDDGGTTWTPTTF